MEDERLKNKNFIDAWKKALSGIWYAVKTQRNIKVQLCIAVVVIICAIIFKLNITECMFLHLQQCWLLLQKWSIQQ